MNPANFFKIKLLWDKFTVNHPKFPRFLQAAAQASLGTNIRLTEEDLELFQEMKDMVMR